MLILSVHKYGGTVPLGFVSDFLLEKVGKKFYYRAHMIGTGWISEVFPRKKFFYFI
jgi:hypothetical protein